MTEQHMMREIDAAYAHTDEGLMAAIGGYHFLAQFHEKNTVPRGYSRSASDIQVYRDVAKLLELVRDAMGEEGVTPSEDAKMTKAMECLGLTWR